MFFDVNSLNINDEKIFLYNNSNNLVSLVDLSTGFFDIN